MEDGSKREMKRKGWKGKEREVVSEKYKAQKDEGKGNKRGGRLNKNNKKSEEVG